MPSVDLTNTRGDKGGITLRGKGGKGGPWVARAVKLGGKYGIEREFARGEYDKYTKNTRYTLAQGWYESGPVRLVYAVDQAGAVITVQGKLPTTALVGPAPGEPGSWAGGTCKCGRPVEYFDQDGWPECQVCRDTAGGLGMGDTE